MSHTAEQLSNTCTVFNGRLSSNGFQVRWAMVQCNTTLGRWAVNYELIKSAYDAWETWAARTNAAAPNTARRLSYQDDRMLSLSS